MTANQITRIALAVLALSSVSLPAAVPAAQARKHAARKHKHKRKHRHHKTTPAPTPPATTPGPSSRALIGTFKLTSGSYTRGVGGAGTYFRMIESGGSIKRGPFLSNGSSSAGDQSYTLLRPGTDGGLISGGYQPPPNPAFGGALNNARANRIVQPQTFEGINFSVSTSPTDPQTATAVPAPSITDDGGKLSGKVQAFAAEWSGQYFNQGSPKPDGSSPGITTPLGGTYNETTHAFVISWTSTIVGGPFNGFTGYWHLEGVFQPSA